MLNAFYPLMPTLINYEVFSMETISQQAKKRWQFDGNKIRNLFVAKQSAWISLWSPCLDVGIGTFIDMMEKFSFFFNFVFLMASLLSLHSKQNWLHILFCRYNEQNGFSQEIKRPPLSSTKPEHDFFMHFSVILHFSRLL